MKKKRERQRGKQNIAERALQNICSKLDKSFTRRGYPDFTIFSENGEIFGFIEVKPSLNKALKKNQEIFKLFCQKYSIPFIKWTPEMGENEIINFLNTNKKS